MKGKPQQIYYIKVKTTSNSSFPERLQYAMDVRDFTQQTLAERIFVARTTVNGYCTGYRMPSCELLRSIAIVLNVTTDYLLGLDDCIKIY